MEKTTARRPGGARLLFGAALWCAIAAFCFAAEPATKPVEPAAKPAEPSTNVPLQDLSSILGPDSQLLAGPDGEFQFVRDTDGQLENFRAVRDVVLLTKDTDLRCHEMNFDRSQGLITATAQDKGLVRITMRGANKAGPAGLSGSQSDTYATCGHYEYYVNEKRHVLSENPIIYQKDNQGKEAAVVGELITMTQDKTGKWYMHVKRNPGIIDPKRMSELDRVRERAGNISRPVVTIDTATAKTSPPLAAPAKAVKIDEGNLVKLEQPKPRRVIKLEEGG